VEGPAREDFIGSLLLTDISGFTHLTAKLCEQNHSTGAERVSDLLNTFLASLISKIEAHGGTVLGFEGDSLLAGWLARSQADLESIAWQSCSCAVHIRTEAKGPIVEDRPLNLRFAVGAGGIALLHVTPNPGQRRLVISGDCQTQVAHCGQITDSGEIVVSRETWRLIEARSLGRPGRDETVRLEQIEAYVNDEGSLSTDHTETSDKLVTYLPPALRERLQSGLAQWLAELRTITAMFIHVERPKLQFELEGVQALVKSATKAVTFFGGEVLDIRMQASSMEVFAVFGLPGRTHTDNPKRAILAALRISNDIAVRPSVGIATGETFCGTLGASHRACYTVVGEAPNTASRLASVAAGRIFADRATADAAHGQIDFDGPWSLHIPGIRGVVPAFVPISALSVAEGRKRPSLVGREAELGLMRNLLKGGKRSGALLLAGHPGVGKSALLRSFMKGARARGAYFLFGSADEVERGTPYFAWRPIVRDLLGLGEARGDEAHRIVQRFFEKRLRLAMKMPLLNDVLDLTLPETRETRSMSGDSRARNLRKLICQLVAEFVESRHSVLLVLEDIHWLDEASGLLLGSVLSDRLRVPLLASTRSLDSESDLKRWVSSGKLDIRTHILYPLDFENSAKLARLLMGESRIGQSEDFIYAQSGGYPFLICEICRILNERAGSRSADLSDVPSSAVSTDETELLNTARSIVLMRTDSLPADTQVVLKLASAVGTSFRSADLQALAPIRLGSVDVDQCLSKLRLVDLLAADAARPGYFVFAHAIIRTAIYESMLAKQRREAHAVIASAMEEAGQPDNAESLPVILSHWERADDVVRSHDYLDRVAELRLRQFDNAAVIDLATRFLRIADEGIAEIDKDRRMAAFFVLAEANLNLGKVESAKESYKAGLRLAGVPLPESQASLFFHLGLDLLEQVWRRLIHWDKNWILKRELAPASERSMMASRAHEDLTRIYYFTSEKLRLLQAILRATNLAERKAFITPTTASNYASLGAICGVIPLRRQARHYSNLATALMERIDDPGTRIRVYLLSGLYETSIGRWLEARRLFTAGIEQALALGDMRRWCEQAVGLETISGPWLLTSAFMGVERWQALVARICQEGRDRGDIQVLGCGLLGGIRGYAALGLWSQSSRMLEEFASILDHHAKGLELVHCIEGTSFLAQAAFARGDHEQGNRWLEQAIHWTCDLNPAMKTRTLPAIVRLFEVAFEPGNADVPRLRLIRSKLRRFAHAIAIGGPTYFRCEAMLQARLGNPRRANRYAMRAFDMALRLEMPAEAVAVVRRFPIPNGARQRLRQMLTKSDAPWNEVLGSGPVADPSPNNSGFQYR
jgi:class 3 adenylate cyclase